MIEISIVVLIELTIKIHTFPLLSLSSLYHWCGELGRIERDRSLQVESSQLSSNRSSEF